MEVVGVASQSATVNGSRPSLSVATLWGHDVEVICDVTV